MPENTRTFRSSMMNLLALRSVIELPIAQRYVLDPEVLRTVAEVDRVGDLTRFNVADVPELAHVSNSKELLTPDEHGWALGHALSLAVEHGQHLWLSEVTPEQLAQLREILGKELVHIASVHDSEDDNTVVVAVSPRQLLWSPLAHGNSCTSGPTAPLSRSVIYAPFWKVQTRCGSPNTP